VFKGLISLSALHCTFLSHYFISHTLNKCRLSVTSSPSLPVPPTPRPHCTQPLYL